MATLPPYVSTGEVIESAWGNAVVDNLAEVKEASGSVNITPPTGWSGTFLVRRNFRSVWMVLNLTRSGTTISTPTNVSMGFIPAAYRPVASFGGIAIVSTTNNTFRAPISGSTGEVSVSLLEIPNGSVLSLSEHWEQ